MRFHNGGRNSNAERSHHFTRDVVTWCTRRQGGGGGDAARPLPALLLQESPTIIEHHELLGHAILQNLLGISVCP